MNEIVEVHVGDITEVGLEIRMMTTAEEVAAGHIDGTEIVIQDVDTMMMMMIVDRIDGEDLIPGR